MILMQGASLVSRLRFSFLVLVSGLVGCAPPRAMCRAESECGATHACVAGRCQAARGHARIQSARRLRLTPRRVECGASHAHGTTCPAGEPLSLEFAFTGLRPEDEIVESYLSLCLVESPAAELIGHAEDNPQVVLLGSTPLRRTPPSHDVGLARTRLLAGDAACPIRLDVLDLTRKWKARGTEEGSLVIFWDGPGSVGTQVALEPTEPAGDMALELYVR